MGLLRNLRLAGARLAIGLARRVSTPDDYLSAVNYTLRQGDMRDYLIELGTARLADHLYELAESDSLLRKKLTEDAAERLFHNFYPLVLKDPALREYLSRGGIDDMYRHLHALATDIGTPLAQRAVSYSQEGEDLILSRLFPGRDDGLYIDVGAHHPFRFSNTYLLYLRGWRGINIDGMPGSMALFERWRPEDINIECLVSNDTTPRRFFQYDEPALNTMSEEVARKRQIEAPQYRIVGDVTLQARPLASLLTDHVPVGKAIDVLNVDVEGLDLSVLESNNWDRFRPLVVVAEILATSYARLQDDPLYRFLSERGYVIHSKLFNTAIFQRNDAGFDS